jgi:hypothetical protein
MRLWTVHPKYLDAKGLVALWREGLLAKAVLEERTKGYRNHPQLARFRDHQQPKEALYQFLHFVLIESVKRNYSFNAQKIPPLAHSVQTITETRGQLAYEWEHLLGKLSVRDPTIYEALRSIEEPEPNPFFILVEGDVRSWENVA